MTNNHSIAHPNPGHYDNRTGLGYGQTQNKFHKQRPVSSGEYGIYSPKGNWDKEIELDKVKNKKKKKKSRKSQKLKSKMNKMNFSSQFRDATDSLSYRSSDPFSFVGAAGAGHTTLRANHNIEGIKLLEAFVQESISGNHYVRRSGKGNMYPRQNVVSDKASGQAPSYTRGGQYRTYKKTGNRLAARGYTVNKPEAYFLYDDEYRDEESTWDKINPDTHDSDKEHIDNIELHIQNILNLT